VYLAVASRGGKTETLHRLYPGDRGAVRIQTVVDALRMIKARAEGKSYTNFQ
jgi:nicotinamide mononucleotide (NMN) deamidase PncC